MSVPSNRNPFTKLLCDIEHRPKSARARRFYFYLQRFINGRNIEHQQFFRTFPFSTSSTGSEETAQAEVDENIFSIEEIQKIARVACKIRIIDVHESTR